MKIVIVDTGISDSYRSNQNRIHRMNTEFGYDTNGHGTLVTNILDERVIGQDIYNFKVSNDTKHITYEDLVDTLKMAYSLNPDIINLSLGISNDDKKLIAQILKKEENKNTLVVAAAENYGAISYPAHYSETLSVIWDPKIRRLNEFYLSDNRNVNIIGCGASFSANGLNGVETISGSSFLAPLLVAHIVNHNLALDSGKGSKENIIRSLKKFENSFFNAAELTNNPAIDTMSMAITFPWNKEIRTLVNNADMLNIEITGVYDAPFSGEVGRSIQDKLYRNQNITGAIQDIYTLDWSNTNFDTIIVGHLEMLSNLYKFNFLSYLQRQAHKYNKNLYCLDSENNQDKIESYHHTNDVASGSLYQVHVPVVAIVGLGSKIGKADLEIRLHKAICQRGYRSKLFMTEPYFELVKYSTGWVNGYNTKSETWETEVLSVNRILHRIDLTNPDLIFVGTQSHVMPLSFSNVGFIPIQTQDVLMAANPDAFILVLNKDIAIKQTQRTINYLESYFNAKVICKYLVNNDKTKSDLDSFSVNQIIDSLIEFF